MRMLMPTLDRFRAQRIVDWLPDLALSGALTVVTQVDVWARGVFPGPTLVNSALALLMTGALLWRRRRPVPVLAIIVTAIAAQALAFGAVESAAVLLPLLAAVYAAAAYGGPAYVVAAISLLAAAVHTLRDPAVITLGDAAFTPLVAGSVFVLGRIVHARRTSAEIAHARADQVQRDREREIADAIAEERRRIAREMHDAVAHGSASWRCMPGPRSRYSTVTPSAPATRCTSSDKPVTTWSRRWDAWLRCCAMTPMANSSRCHHSDRSLRRSPGCARLVCRSRLSCTASHGRSGRRWNSRRSVSSKKGSPMPSNMLRTPPPACSCATSPRASSSRSSTLPGRPRNTPEP